MSDIYCKAPWTSTTYMPGGKFTPCCSWGGNHFDSPEQVRDVVGGAFLRGEIPKECMGACPPDKPGWRQMFQHYPTDLVNLQVHFLDFRNNNLCNLKCRSCGPGFSTSWASELGHPVIHLHEETELGDIDLTHVQQIYFAGGEPLLNPQHYQLLEKLIAAQLQPRIMYSTNMTVLGYKNKHVKDYWSKFKQINVNASLDAVGDVLETVRSGSEWSQVEENINWCKSQSYIKLSYSPVISAINIWWIDQLFDYFSQQQIKMEQFQPVLANPDGAEGLALIPWEFRDALISKLEKAPYQNENVSRAIDVLRTQDATAGWWKFMAQQLMMDHVRGEFWFDRLPVQQQVYRKIFADIIPKDVNNG